MFWILKMIRIYIGGKTEIGITLIVLAGILFILPVLPQFTWEALKAVWLVIGSLTGVSFLSRIENKEGIFKALQSLFSAFKKSPGS